MVYGVRGVWFRPTYAVEQIYNTIGKYSLQVINMQRVVIKLGKHRKLSTIIRTPLQQNRILICDTRFKALSDVFLKITK